MAQVFSFVAVIKRTINLGKEVYGAIKDLGLWTQSKRGKEKCHNFAVFPSFWCGLYALPGSLKSRGEGVINLVVTDGPFVKSQRKEEH